jgi:hypothetical protein
LYCSVAELGSTRLSVDPVQELLLVSRVGLELEDVCREGFGEGLLGTARSVGSKEASIERAPLLAGGGCFASSPPPPRLRSMTQGATAKSTVPFSPTPSSLQSMVALGAVSPLTEKICSEVQTQALALARSRTLGEEKEWSGPASIR